jgi:hypothetical protein
MKTFSIRYVSLALFLISCSKSDFSSPSTNPPEGKNKGDTIEQRVVEDNDFKSIDDDQLAVEETISKAPVTGINMDYDSETTESKEEKSSDGGSGKIENYYKTVYKDRERIFCGATEIKYSGDVGGFKILENICQEACADPEASICRDADLLSTNNRNIDLGQEWLWFLGFVGYDAGFAGVSSCKGWTSMDSSSSGALVHNSTPGGLYIAYDYCHKNYKFACCAPVVVD